jgi:hypothetical protein
MIHVVSLHMVLAMSEVQTQSFDVLTINFTRNTPIESTRGCAAFEASWDFMLKKGIANALAHFQRPSSGVDLRIVAP